MCTRGSSSSRRKCYGSGGIRESTRKQNCRMVRIILEFRIFEGGCGVIMLLRERHLKVCPSKRFQGLRDQNLHGHLGQKGHSFKGFKSSELENLSWASGPKGSFLQRVQAIGGS